MPKKRKKSGEKIEVTTRYGKHKRSLPSVKNTNLSPEYLNASQRTRNLNKLASSVNRIITSFSFVLENSLSTKNKDFYERVHGAFRRILSDHRYHLLLQLVNVEVNIHSLMNNILIYDLDVSTKPGNLHVQLKSNAFSMPSRPVDCYKYEVLVIQWLNGKDDPRWNSQETEWVIIPDKNIVFNFDFLVLKDCQQWMVCVKGRYGKNKKSLDTFDTLAVNIDKVGSFDPEDLALGPPELKPYQPRRSKKDPDPIIPSMVVKAEKPSGEDPKNKVSPETKTDGTNSPGSSA